MNSQIEKLPMVDKIEIYKKCFLTFINNDESYKPIYHINNLKIERRYFLAYKQIYYEEYANMYERKLYSEAIARRKNKKYEKLIYRYKTAFDYYVDNLDTEEFYKQLAIESRVSIETAKKYPYHYYERYATDEQREKFDIAKQNKLEQNQKIRTENMYNKLKYLFDVCISSEFNQEKLEMLVKKYNLSIKTIKNYLLKYYELYATPEEKEQYKKLRYRKNERTTKETYCRYAVIFNDIYDMRIEKAIIYLLNKGVNDLDYLYSSINLYCQDNLEKDENKIKKILDQYKKYLQYRDKKETEVQTRKQIEELENELKQIELKKKQLMITKENQKRKKILLSYIELVSKYNRSKISNYEEFCLKNSISLDKFKIALKITYKLKPEIYKKFILKNKSEMKKQYPNEIKELELILSNLENDEQNFDVLDYYIITKKTFEEMYEIAKKYCTKNQLITLRNFYENNKPNNEFNISKVLTEKYVITNYDEIVEVTSDDKKKAIHYLKENNIPIYDKTYLSILKRNVFDEKGKQKTKVA